MRQTFLDMKEQILAQIQKTKLSTLGSSSWESQKLFYGSITQLLAHQHMNEKQNILNKYAHKVP